MKEMEDQRFAGKKDIAPRSGPFNHPCRMPPPKNDYRYSQQGFD